MKDYVNFTAENNILYNSLTAYRRENFVKRDLGAFVMETCGITKQSQEDAKK